MLRHIFVSETDPLNPVDRNNDNRSRGVVPQPPDRSLTVGAVCYRRYNITLIEPKLNEGAVGDQRSALSLRIWKVFLYLIYACFINVEVKNINLTADC